MKYKFLLFALLPFCSIFCYGDELWQSFISPAQEARTKLWWFHGETITTKEGIDADLQAFKDAGIGGVVFYDQTHGSEEGAFASLSPEWWDMLKYAAKKSKEVGLTFEMASTNGYVAGGPWITPELGMQHIVVLRPGDKRPEGFNEIMKLSSFLRKDDDFIDSVIQRDRISLADNEAWQIISDLGTEKEVRTISYTASPRAKGSYGSMNIPGEPQEKFFGAGYVHFPPIGELECSDDGKTWRRVVELKGVEDIIGYKSKQRTINFHPVKARYFRIIIHDWLGSKSKYNKLDLDNIRLMSYDMIDNWEEKSGLRSEIRYEDQNISFSDNYVPFIGEAVIGYAPTGGHSKHGRSRIVWNGKELQSKTWLEADVLNATAVKHHYNSYFKAVLDTLSAIGCAPTGMHLDSHEAGIANWTADMPSHFKRLRGYDIDKWIPALGGYIVENRKDTEDFLHDYRLTISELIQEQFYSTLADLCHCDGVKMTSQAMLGCINDNIASRGMVDKPQGEFWAYQKNGNFDCLDAASAAHLYGKRIASGEAFTDSPYFYPSDSTDATWKERGWHNLLRIANLAYCRGINEFVVCASSYQPWLDKKYDDSKSSHPYIFHRLNPAWDASKEHFWEYQARCSQLLQTGLPVVDLLIYIGEELPLKTLTYKLPHIPEGYQYDCCTLSSLKEWTKTDSDVSPQYKMLVVQGRTYISDEAEKIFEELESKGIKIVRCDKDEELQDALEKAELRPDIMIKSANLPDDKVHFYHRKTDEADIYFVYNHSKNDYTSPIDLRTENNNIELWNPLTLEKIKPLNNSFSLKPYSSLFIVAKAE